MSRKHSEDRKAKYKKYYYMGEWLNVPELSEKYGIPKKLISSRLTEGWPIERAMILNPPKKVKRHLYKGQMLTASDLAEMAGCSTKVMISRLSTHTAEEAVAMGKTNVRKRNHSLEKDEAISEAVLKVWRCGDKTVDEIIEETGLRRSQINRILPVKEIEEYEAEAKKEILSAYGYMVKGD